MTKNITAKTNTKTKDRKEVSKNNKEISYLETFKEMYGRSQEELKAFIECMCLKKEEQTSK